MISLRIKISIPEWLPKVAIIFFINAALLVTAYSVFAYAYKDRVYPGVYVGQIDLGGKYYDEADVLIREKIDRFGQEGVKFAFNNEELLITPVMSSAQNDLAYEIIKIDAENTINTAFNYGKTGNILNNIKNAMIALVFGKKFPFLTNLNEPELTKNLEKWFARFETPAENAKLILDNDKIAVKKEISGKTINYEKSIKLLKINLKQLDNSMIKLYMEDSNPKVYAANCKNLIPQAEEILNVAPIYLINGKNKW
ncbi:MAG: peptidoglycan binding domain-containing protein [Patescibacteria group bacterium]